MWILIRWLHHNQSDLDLVVVVVLFFFKKRIYPSSAGQGLNVIIFFSLYVHRHEKTKFCCVQAAKAQTSQSDQHLILFVWVDALHPSQQL